MKKLLAGILTLSIVLSSNGIAIAAEAIEENPTSTEHQADIVENIVGTGEVNPDIDSCGINLTVKGEAVNLGIPQNGSGAIDLETFAGTRFSIGLPKDIKNANAEVTEKGTVIYNGEEDVSVVVQAIRKEQCGLTIEGIRSMIVIKDEKASKEYEFDYNLPAGYGLMTSEEYYGTKNAEKGYIYS